MAEKVQQPGELALVKAVRSLDQGGSKAIPDKLDQIWKILSIYTGGNFHAAEEMLVRWLLKNMNGSSEDAQKLRRYPLTWRILGKAFTSVPLFSLAKSLADRRFVPILQTTLNDASKPIEAQTSDTELADVDFESARPSKKKRSETVKFDLESQSNAEGCLRTADALFDAVKLLLARLDSGDTKRDRHMGAEHIKSLFCSSASDIKDLILPALLVCKVWAANYPENEGNDWVSTICDLWDLHLQGDGDAMQVAAHLASPAISILGNTPDIGMFKPTPDALRYFLTRNLILPARAAFLNHGDLEIIRQTIQSTAGFSTVSCPVILDLSLSSPSLTGSQTAKRDNESWAQGVFSVLIETLQSSRSARKLAAVQKMLDKIRELEIAISVDSLRAVCKNFALQTATTEWDILALVAQIDPDVFIREGGDGLLQSVLDRVRLPAKSDLDDGWSSERELKARTVNRIASGFAKARNASSFVKLWFEHLSAIGPQAAGVDNTEPYRTWYFSELCKTVGESVERTMNAKQILSLIDWLESRANQPAENATVILLSEVISRCIKQDDVTDTVGMRLFETVSKRSLPPSVNKAVSASKWTVARRCLEWATLEQANEIWAASVVQLREVLLPSPPTDSHTFEAFKFAAAAWLENYPGGQNEDDAAKLTLASIAPLNDVSLFLPLDAGEQRVIGYFTDMYGGWKGWGYEDHDGCPRLLSMILERDQSCIFELLRFALTFKVDREADFGMENPERNISRISSIFDNEDNINSRATMDTVFKLICADMEVKFGSNQIPRVAKALLALPDEAITREQREELMRLLVKSIAARANRSGDSLERVRSIVSLMIKLMRKPTFYPNMAFSDLHEVAVAVENSVDYSSKGEHEHMASLPLVEELARLTIRQMTANVGTREEDYLRQAVSTMKEQMRPALGGADNLTVFRVVLLKLLILAVKETATVKVLGNTDIRELEHHLVEMIESVVEQFCSRWEKTSIWRSDLPVCSAVLEATEDIYQHAAAEKLSGELKKALAPYLPRLRDASRELESQKNCDVWVLRKYLARASGKDTENLLDLCQITGVTIEGDDDEASVSATGNKEGILAYIDTVTADADDDARLAHIEALMRQSDASNRPVRLLAIQRIIQQLGNKATTQNTSVDRPFELSTLHTALCKSLRSTESQAEFVLMIQILETILDEKANSMTQWNIELTLSTVSVLASEATTHVVMSTTPKAYKWLCRLVQVIIRRHRLRLEGHFHLLVTVLQSLLRALVCHPYFTHYRYTLNLPGNWTAGLIKDPWQFGHWEKHAKAFGRLLTMVCEPTPGSVARSQQNSLDSATDAAKRYAGQHMYLVLMLYIKLQLEQNVPHDVREALEPGVFAILDITTPEARRVMNDALDPSGRAIMKELYKQYLKFGKWSGI